MEAKLVVVGGDLQARQYELQLPTVIGRSRGSDLTLGHPLVSRLHCEIFEANGMLMVRDLGSLNGTFVGDQRIAEQAMPVKPGDMITVGPVTFRAVYGIAPRKRAPGQWNPHSPTLDAPFPDERDELKKTPAKGRYQIDDGSDEDQDSRN